MPGQIKSINGRKAEVIYSDTLREVLVGKTNVKKGDWVMVEMGVITEVMDPKEAKSMLAAWKEAEL